MSISMQLRTLQGMNKLRREGEKIENIRLNNQYSQWLWPLTGAHEVILLCCHRDTKSR